MNHIKSLEAAFEAGKAAEIELSRYSKARERIDAGIRHMNTSVKEVTHFYTRSMGLSGVFREHVEMLDNDTNSSAISGFRVVREPSEDGTISGLTMTFAPCDKGGVSIKTYEVSRNDEGCSMTTLTNKLTVPNESHAVSIMDGLETAINAHEGDNFVGDYSEGGVVGTPAWDFMNDFLELRHEVIHMGACDDSTMTVMTCLQDVGLLSIAGFRLNMSKDGKMVKRLYTSAFFMEKATWGALLSIIEESFPEI